VATATVKIKTVGAFDSNMDAEVWKSFGIEYKDVDPENDFILDVRKSSPNFAEGHIKGAVNVDVTAGAIADGDAVAQALEKAYTDAKGKKIVVVCNSGQTLAKRAMEYYRTHGKDMGTITYLIGGNGAVPAADLVK
jgi:rhodanese-related sulfurtransferase